MKHPVESQKWNISKQYKKIIIIINMPHDRVKLQKITQISITWLYYTCHCVQLKKMIFSHKELMYNYQENRELN